jgi:hypothetical protein
MRWNDLFADLEGQLAAAADAQFSADVSDRTRSERAAVPLQSRLAASVGSRVVVTLLGSERVSGELTDVAATWILVNEDARQTWIPVAAICAASGLVERSAGVSLVARRLSMGHALRALSRDRAWVTVVTMAASWRGVVSQSGADYVDIHDRESGAITSVPFAAILRVSSTAERM